MWSPFYYYINIYKDEELSESCSTIELRNFLNSLPELKQVSDFHFSNSDALPFIEMLLLNARSNGSWDSNDTSNKKTNLVAIVCAKSTKEEFESIKEVLIKVAIFLNWDLVDERSDDEIDNFIIWSPPQPAE